MQRRHPVFGILLWLLLAPPTFEAIVSAETPAQTQVLVLYSTRRDAQIVTVGERELPRILEKGVPNLDYYSEYLDHGRFQDEKYQATFREFLFRKYRHIRFDAVIAVQDAALELVLGARTELFPGAPIVFFATAPVSGPIENATGLVVGLNFGDTLALVDALQPQVRRIFVVGGAGASDRQYESIAREQLKPFETRFDITYLTGLPSAELEARVSALPSNSAVYYLLVNRDGNGENVHPLEYAERLAARANAPVYCWVDSAMNRGIVGGSLKDQTVQLEALGRLALRVLSGESAATVPVSSPNLNVRQVDWRQLRRWGIDEARVPTGTQVLFKQPSAWDRYRNYILAAAALVLAQALLIGGLLFERRWRRVAEGQVRGSEDALRRSFDRIRDLGSRLLHAQDTERSRIARELHDDISQQVALLSIDLELLSGAAPGDSRPLADEALNRVQDVARSVHDLSHRLHPTKLRLIGLVAALQGLQREHARSEPDITFTHEHVPANLSHDLTLSLYRIVQEVLQNAVKYSRARKIAVDLRGGPDGLALTVSDDGVGFDIEAAWGKGLGLISIGERIEAIGGTVDLQSSPGRGTTFAIRVPLAAAAPADAVG